MNYKKIIQKEIPQINTEVLEFIKNPVICELLAQRGIKDINDVKKYIDCKNQRLSTLDIFTDGQKVLERIRKAINNKEKILVWGDFDSDGVTSSALMHKTLSLLNADFEVFIPNREEHGHGINSKEALRLVSKHKIKLMITVDCGISNISEVNLLKSLGVDVIITDHHKVEGDIPNAYAILNPQAPNSLVEKLSVKEIEDLSRLAGVGVAYKLALALLEQDENEELLALACTGTISDVVPLIGENRTIVSRGLDAINNGANKGISILFKNLAKNNITSTDIAFLLTPRINAVGRLSTPELAFDFLTQNNESTLNFLIEKLDNFNKIRQSLCENIYLEAKELTKDCLNESAIVLFNSDWHIGIIGIVASKIVDDTQKPVFMVTKDTNGVARCSIRSVAGYNVYEILKKNSDLFLGYGGHSLAGGFSFDLDKHSFDEIKEALLNTIDESEEKASTDITYVDKFLNPQEINKDFIEKISILEPFGQENPQPVFALNNTILINSKTIGKNSNHLKFFCQKDGYEFECIKWCENEFNLPPNSKIDIAFYPHINTFNGSENIQLEIFDVYCERFCHQKCTKSLKLFDHRKKTGILPQISDYLSKDSLDIVVWAKKIKTLNLLKKYPQIENRICKQVKKHQAVMFFDYPSNTDEMRDILSKICPSKIHFMNNECNDNMEDTLKTISGMLKFAHNHKNGVVDILKIAQATGTSEIFVQLSLEIFENCGTIDILDVDKICYLKPIDIELIKKQSLFELLNDEFSNISDFKKHLANDDIDKMYEIINSCIK